MAVSPLTATLTIFCPVIGIWDEAAIKGFGNSIRQKRMQCGFSQEELAYRCQIYARQIGRIKRGEINTSISTVFSLVRALNLEVANLFDSRATTARSPKQNSPELVFWQKIGSSLRL